MLICLFVYHICMYIDDYMYIDDIIDICLCMYNENSSYDVAVIQWITSCHKNRMTTGYITCWHVQVTS